MKCRDNNLWGESREEIGEAWKRGLTELGLGTLEKEVQPC